ncbi:hypothetical protein ELZ88_24145 (plasmid) [Salmonella enterica subsp. enterica serovar Karamoja]|uniref:Uncharacterized protein n=1 Tax=Salmonella enterica subsp. enterica serovar Karamoja TaxID=2500153 RepID=A0A3Q9MSX2_SALET|nr:hypothetical protein ELZ88_24145 [Salmonella enterica subsp. enterica serovar Karamoja]
MHWPLRKAGKPASSVATFLPATAETTSLLKADWHRPFPETKAAAKLLSGGIYFPQARNKYLLHLCIRPPAAAGPSAQ